MMIFAQQYVISRVFTLIFIGNYKKDRQESMLRFTDLLSIGFNQAGYSTDIWFPEVHLGKIAKSTTKGLGKWIGYIDKWILYPFILKAKIRREKESGYNIRYHVCDHSNSTYLKYLPLDSTAITCHDVLAIRGAKGYKDAYISASPFGKIIHYILWSL